MISSSISLKITPDFFFKICNLASDATATVILAAQQGGVNANQGIIALYEFAPKLKSQYFAWQGRTSTKLYSYKLPLSVAIAVVQLLEHTEGQLERRVWNTLYVRLHDSGIDINHYLVKKLT